MTRDPSVATTREDQLGLPDVRWRMGDVDETPARERTKHAPVLTEECLEPRHGRRAIVDIGQSPCRLVGSRGERRRGDVRPGDGSRYASTRASNFA